MSGLSKRVPVGWDWLLAAFLGIVIYNLNVTSQGAPLNGVGGAPGPASAGITDGARTAFYVALAVTGAVLTVGGFALIVAERRWRSAGALASRSFAGLTAVGLAGLLLDYRDGPVSWLHLAVYVLMVLGLIRFVRVSAMLASAGEDEPALQRT